MHAQISAATYRGLGLLWLLLATLPWIAPSDVRHVRVCITRHPSEKFDNQIQGTAWIDDVALVPENPKP